MAKFPFAEKYSGQDHKYLLPGSDVDPRFKLDEKGEYVKKVIESLYSKFINGRLGDISFYDKIDILRMYGAGKQPQSIYETWAYGGQAFPSDYVQQIVNGVDQNVTELEDKLKKGWHSVNFSVVSPMPKIKAAIRGMLDSVDFDIHVDTLDPVSNKKVEDSAWGLWNMRKNMEFLKKVHTQMGIPFDEPAFIPENLDELNMFKAAEGLKLNCARLMQMLVKYTNDLSGYDELKEMASEDFLDIGKACYRDVIDLEKKKVALEYQDPKYFFIQPSNYPDHRDSSFAGCIKEYDISYLSSMGIPRTVLEGVAKSYCGLLGNPKEWEYYNVSTGDRSFGYDFFKVATVEAAWIEEDTKYKRYVRNRHGGVRIYNADYGYAPKKDNEWVKTFKTRMLYEGSWVVGTDIVFSFGLVYNAPRNKGEVKLPFHYYELPFASMVESIIPFLDEFMHCWLMYQNGMTLAPPDGTAIDMSMIAGVNITEGKAANAADVINFAKRTRYYPYMKSPSGKYEGGNPTPFSPVVGITEKILRDTDTRFLICLNRISENTGVSMVSLGTSPATIQATTAQLEYNATMNVLKPIIKGTFKLKESAAENVVWRIKNAINFDKTFKKSYADVLSESDIKLLEEAEGWGAQYGNSLVARPSDRDKENIINGLNISLQRDELDQADMIFIIEQLNANVDLKLLRMYLSYKVKKNKELKHQQQLEIVTQQGQDNLTLRQEQSKAIMAKSQMDLQAGIQLEDKKHNDRLVEENEQLKGDIQKLLIELQAKQDENRKLLR